MDAIEALGDPVRREILDHLRSGDSRAGDIAHLFDLSRPAISRHLRVLRESGLIVAARVGRERLYALNPGPIRAAREWIDSLLDGLPVSQPDSSLAGAPLDEAHLDALATEVVRTRRDSRGAAAELNRHETNRHETKEPA